MTKSKLNGAEDSFKDRFQILDTGAHFNTSSPHIAGGGARLVPVNCFC